jgi:hypothetical protein
LDAHNDWMRKRLKDKFVVHGGPQC